MRNQFKQRFQEMSLHLAKVMEGRGKAANLIKAAGCVIPVEAGFCVTYQREQRPHYLADTFTPRSAKEAVQLYVNNTFLLNPVYNAYLAGIAPGVYRMAELSPDNWKLKVGAPDVYLEEDEEIGYRTPGWPAGLEELAVLVDLGNGAMGEISLARATADGGMSKELVNDLSPYYPLFASAYQKLWEQYPNNNISNRSHNQRLEDFGADILSPREAEVIQLVLKGHSSLSISLTLGVALPTVKTHRKNAYAKLGINTQQQLFNAFLMWEGSDNAD